MNDVIKKNGICRACSICNGNEMTLKDDICVGGRVIFIWIFKK